MNQHADVFPWTQLFLLKGEATRTDVQAACAEAKKLGVYGVCVHSAWVSHAYTALEGSDVKIACMIGFPFGTSQSDAKRYEVEIAVDDGAQEIELVLNLGKIKEADTAYLLRELRDIVEAADERPVSVVAEMSLLTKEEKIRVADIAAEGGAKFVKTSTGLQIAGPEDLKTLSEAAEPKCGIILAGHLPNREAAAALLQAGARRISVPAGSAWLKQ